MQPVEAGDLVPGTHGATSSREEVVYDRSLTQSPSIAPRTLEMMGWLEIDFDATMPIGLRLRPRRLFIPTTYHKSTTNGLLTFYSVKSNAAMMAIQPPLVSALWNPRNAMDH